jgi:hypothetical protein
MGSVYEAQQDQPRRLVALKVLRGALGSRGSVRRFEEEAGILARLRHPGIAQVYEAGTYDDGGGATPYFAMELVPDACPIVAFARERRLGVRERLALFLAACDAVSHGHQRAVIHRDLKPGNILVDREGRPKVIDFGVARTIGPEPDPVTQQVVGTLSYMSPEQCAGPGEADVRSDVYALGVVLYELLVGTRPYEVEELSLPEAARVVREGPVTRPSAAQPELRGDLETIMLKALEKDPRRRYQSVAELSEDLQRLLSNRPILARPATMVYQARMFARRNKGLVGAIAAIAATLVVATAVSMDFGLRAGERAREAEAARTAQAVEAARARRISVFLEGALGSANPFVPSGAPPDLLATDYEPWADWRISPWPFAGKPGEAASARDVLRAAGARLETDFADDPVAQARLADILGWTLFRLRDISAEGLLRRSLELRTESLGPDHSDTMRSALHLAELLDGLGREGEGEPLYRSVLEACRRSFGPLDARTLRVERMLAHNLAYLQRRTPEAISLIEGSTGALEQGEQRPALLEHQAYLAQLFAVQGDWSRARSVAQASVVGLTGLVGGDDIRTGAALHTLADILTEGPGGAEEAVTAALAAQQVQARWFGEQSLQWAASRSLAAQALDKAARYDESGKAWAQTAEVFERLMGAADFETARARGEQAREMLKAGTELERAQGVALAAAATMDKLFTSTSGYGLGYRTVAADCAHKAGRMEEAMRILDGVIADLRAQVVPDGRPGLARALRRKASWLREQGEAERAASFEKEAADLERGTP